MTIFKLVSLLASLLFLSSWSKELSPEESKITQCDNITLTVNNLLSSPLDSIMIGKVNFGTIGAGETEVLCLETSGAYSLTPKDLSLFLQARYKGKEVRDGYFCGTGLVSINSGVFEMDLTEVNGNYLKYVFK